MKILWLCAFQLPKVPKRDNNGAVVTGGWVQSMLEEIEWFDTVEEINVVTVTKSKKSYSYKLGKIKYTLLPSKNGVMKYDPKLYKKLDEEIKKFKPDIIDVQGIEFYLVKSLLKVKTNIPVVATIQGLASEYYKHYYAGIPFHELLINRTLRNIIFFDGLIEKKYKYKKRGYNEIETLKRLKYILGRTSWDFVNTIKHNSDLKYFTCRRNLRRTFYESKWQIDSIERYSLFTTQARYPIKGLHLLLESVKLLSQKYPQLKLYIGGRNMLNKSTLYNKLIFNDYQKYLCKLIRKYNIGRHIIFTGYLESDQVVERLLAAHVFVIPSVIENSPNALGEAQIIGTPSVASLVGGNADYIKDGKSGFLYNAYEPAMLADKIEQVFNDDNLAVSLSVNARQEALLRHDRKKNAVDLINAYQTILRNYAPVSREINKTK